MKTDIKELKRLLGLDVIAPKYRISNKKDLNKLYYVSSSEFPIKGAELAERGIPESQWKEDRWGGWQ